ncbi:MAG: type II toxin-antitoxin system VapC family toxin [Verrucomicrobiota bacterium]|nr:type II toxin-antitoxin system VapC family toxin [Verrucomicrobiota bacterium]
MILDTNAISALLAGDTDLAEVLDVESRHHLPVIVLGEYRYGLLSSRHRKKLEKLLAELVSESWIISPDEETSLVYAQIRHGLKSSGKPIPENDIWIAALACQHDLHIVSRDVHFDHVPQVKRIVW